VIDTGHREVGTENPRRMPLPRVNHGARGGFGCRARRAHPVRDLLSSREGFSMIGNHLLPRTCANWSQFPGEDRPGRSRPKCATLRDTARQISKKSRQSRSRRAAPLNACPHTGCRCTRLPVPSVPLLVGPTLPVWLAPPEQPCGLGAPRSGQCSRRFPSVRAFWPPS